MSAEQPVSIAFDPSRCSSMSWDGPATRWGTLTYGQPLTYGGNVEPLARGLFVSQSGSLTLKNIDGKTGVFENLIAGAWYPFAFAEIVTGTMPDTAVMWLGG